MEKLFTRRRPLVGIENDYNSTVTVARGKRSASFLRSGIDFKRLSVCSFDDFDLNMASPDCPKIKLPTNTFKLSLVPQEGVGFCACTSTWQITILKKIPGKTRKCKIVPLRPRDGRPFTGRIAINEDKVFIWGCTKDDQDFEISLATCPSDYRCASLISGYMKRGNRGKGKELTHDVDLLL